MPHSVKGILAIYEDMVEILLVLKVFLEEDPEMVCLFYYAPFALNSACSSAMIYIACGWSLFSTILVKKRIPLRIKNVKWFKTWKRQMALWQTIDIVMRNFQTRLKIQGNQPSHE